MLLYTWEKKGIKVTQGEHFRWLIIGSVFSKIGCSLFPNGFVHDKEDKLIAYYTFPMVEKSWGFFYLTCE